MTKPLASRNPVILKRSPCAYRLHPANEALSFSAAQVTLAMLTLLGVVLPRVPNTVLRSKFIGCVAVVNRLLEAYREQVRAAHTRNHPPKPASS